MKFSLTFQPLTVWGVNSFRFDTDNSGNFIMVNPADNKVIDCHNARNSGRPCIMWWRHGRRNQQFYKISV